MRKLCLATIATLLFTGSAFAQASGNFSATAVKPACMINFGNNGQFTNNSPTCNLPGTTTTPFSAECGMMAASIKTSSGNGVTLDIRPSLDTGLFTETNISKNTSGVVPLPIPTATADIGIQVCVTVDGSGAGILPASCVIYDQRFQQLSSNLFNAVLPACADATGATAPCNLDLILSTLSAHSFDFVVPVGQGTHTVLATWSVFGQTAATQGSTAQIGACVGPGIITVTQMKVFNNSGSLLQF